MSGGTASAPWKPLLLKALDSNSHLKHSAFFQLATIGSNGRPANRTVVFRGFQENCDKIQINTDARSSKIEDIKRCPFGEVRYVGISQTLGSSSELVEGLISLMGRIQTLGSFSRERKLGLQVPQSQDYST